MLAKLFAWIFCRPCPSCGEPMLRLLERCDGCALADAYRKP